MSEGVHLGFLRLCLQFRCRLCWHQTPYASKHLISQFKPLTRDTDLQLPTFPILSNCTYFNYSAWDTSYRLIVSLDYIYFFAGALSILLCSLVQIEHKQLIDFDHYASGEKRNILYPVVGLIPGKTEKSVSDVLEKAFFPRVRRPDSTIKLL